MIDASIKRPHFRNPPIFEQAIAVVFERQKELSIADPGLFWQLIRDEFPECKHAPRLPNVVELTSGLEPQAMMSAIPSEQLPRVIYESDNTGELIQVQDDKFVFNWVRRSAEDQYPRFETTSARFWNFFETWSLYLKDRHGAKPSLKQCELTNVNVIPVEDFGQDYDDMHEAFKVDPFDWNVSGLVAETYVRQRVHRIVDDSGKILGRLHSTIAPVYSEDGQRAFQFDLTARSMPTVRTLESARDFFDRAHILINGAFLASVTSKMRSAWGEMNDVE